MSAAGVSDESGQPARIWPAGSPSDGLYAWAVLPRPAHVAPAPGRFLPDERAVIYLSHQATELEYAAARQLQESFSQAFRGDVPIERRGVVYEAQGAILLAVCPRDEPLFGPFLSAEARRALATLPPGAEEGYVLGVDEDQVTLLAPTPRGLFNGVQTLRQAADILRMSGQADLGLPGTRIQDWPRLSWRGVLLDVTRGKVPRLEMLFRLVEVLSYFKINALQLYMEHTYTFRRHPLIGEGTGALRCDEILALDRLCRLRNIELIPYFSSFAHMYRITHLPPYSHLGEGPEYDNISPACEETYQLLDELYSELLPAFSSRFFNVGCDETWHLGKGRTKTLVEAKGVGQVYLDHVLRLHRLVSERYGRRLMIWGDMLLRHPELISHLPEDLIILNWNYEARDRYEQIEPFARAGREQWVCPGTSSWNTLFPRLANARRNIAVFVRDGLAAGARGLLNTDWGDGGHANPLGNSWYGYLYGADQAWGHPAPDFERRFAFLFMGDPTGEVAQVAELLGRAVELAPFGRGNGSWTFELFYGPPDHPRLVAIPDEALRALQELAQQAGAVLNRVEAAALRRPGHCPEAPTEVALSLAEWRMAQRQLAHGSARLLAQRAGLSEPRVRQRLLRELRSLRREFERLWHARSRPEGIETTLQRFDARLAELGA